MHLLILYLIIMSEFNTSSCASNLVSIDIYKYWFYEPLSRPTLGNIGTTFSIRLISWLRRSKRFVLFNLLCFVEFDDTYWKKLSNHWSKPSHLLLYLSECFFKISFLVIRAASISLISLCISWVFFLKVYPSNFLRSEPVIFFANWFYEWFLNGNYFSLKGIWNNHFNVGESFYQSSIDKMSAKFLHS